MVMVHYESSRESVPPKGLRCALKAVLEIPHFVDVKDNVVLAKFEGFSTFLNPNHSTVMFGLKKSVILNKKINVFYQ